MTIWSRGLSSNQALPSHARNIISVCNLEGESLEDFDHMLDVVGCGYQLAVSFAHTATRCSRRLDQCRQDRLVTKYSTF